MKTTWLALMCGALLVRAATTTAAIVFDDAGYEVKHTWSATTLGIPTNLGALLFSTDGNTLYVVGASESPVSALYAVPVTRDPVTHEVTDLGPAGSVTKVFSGNASTYGLDAGFDFGPGGTLFYTYWNANYLGERPGGFGGTETRFDMSPRGVPVSVAGLTFSPHLVDPATGFAQMQVSTWGGANLYDVPLTPAGNGVYTPGNATLFVTLPKQGTGAIQYIPSGPSAGDLMYVNWSYGEVHILLIDPATGLPIDKTTGLPTRGTTNPKDARFASGLGGGPWGLEFDSRTNDFFVGTWQGTPNNTIIQIGGFPKTEKCDDGIDDDDDGLVDCDDPDCAASCPSASATASPSPSPSASRSPTPAPSASPTPSPSRTSSPAPSASARPSPAPSPSPAARDDFACYKAPSAKGSSPLPPTTVMLTDALGTTTVTLGKPQLVCPATSTNGSAIDDPTINLRCYKITAAKPAKLAKRTVRIESPFGAEAVTVTKAQTLCVPSELDGLASTLDLDHFVCGKAKSAAGTPKFAARTVRLENRLDASTIVVAKPTLFCTPVSTTGAPLADPVAHLRCYKTRATKKGCASDAPTHVGVPCKQEEDCGGAKGVTTWCATPPKLARVDVTVANDLGTETATVVKHDVLCIRSTEAPTP